MNRNRIEPWEAPPGSYFALTKTHCGEMKGTKVVYDGKTLRARGYYDHDISRALLTALRHAKHEGIQL